MISGNLNDGKAAIPLLKGIEKLPLSIKYGIMDAGYDYTPIYQQLLKMDAHSIIAYNKRREGEVEGYDKYFAPTCVREHSYRYDSYDNGEARITLPRNLLDPYFLSPFNSLASYFISFFHLNAIFYRLNHRTIFWG
jgi:hypothetical protein